MNVMNNRQHIPPNVVTKFTLVMGYFSQELELFPVFPKKFDKYQEKCEFNSSRVGKEDGEHTCSLTRIGQLGMHRINLGQILTC